MSCEPAAWRGANVDALVMGSAERGADAERLEEGAVVERRVVEADAGMVPAGARLQVVVDLKDEPAIASVFTLPVVDPAARDSPQVRVDPELLACGEIDGDE